MSDAGPLSGYAPETITVAGPALRILYWSAWPDGYRSYYPEEKGVLAWLVDTGMIEAFERGPWQTHDMPKTAFRATPFGLAVLARSHREI